MRANRRGVRNLTSKMFRRGPRGSGPALKTKKGNLAVSHFEAGELAMDQPGDTLAWTRTTGAIAAGASVIVSFDDPVVEGIAGQLIVQLSSGGVAGDTVVTQLQVGAQALIHGSGGISAAAFNADPQNEVPLAIAITNENKVAVTLQNNGAAAQTYIVTLLPLED